MARRPVADLPKVPPEELVYRLIRKDEFKEGAGVGVRIQPSNLASKTWPVTEKSYTPSIFIASKLGQEQVVGAAVRVYLRELRTLLDAGNPYGALLEKTKSMLASLGYEATHDLLERLQQELDEQGDEDREEVVLNLLNVLVGWCGADERLSP